jgi:hydrogenase expression/formation protein HypC
MCLGVPMAVVSATPGEALCEVDGSLRVVSTMLIDGAVATGDLLLIHADTAIRRLDAEEARLISNALRAVLAASAGQAYDHLIADLVDREPPLPEHLKSLAQS